MSFIKKIVVVILTWEARAVLKRYKPRVIAVTGSVGKTTTKDAIFAAISNDVYVRKSEKSFNSEIGVPLTILGLENGWKNPFKWIANIVNGFLLVVFRSEYPQWLVLEVGADRPGDIRNTAKWLRPDVAVLTGVPETPVHVEYFDSPEAVVREKRSLAEYLRPGGKLIVNGDDMRVRDIHTAFRGASITYGMEANNEYIGSHVEIVYENGKPSGMRFRSNHAGSSVPVTLLGALGLPRVYAALAAIAVAEVVGIDNVSAGQALGSWTPPPGRMCLIEGVRGSVIIDDTYNSSPAAALSALDTLREIVTPGKKIAVMGDMLELGKYSVDAHKTVGVRAFECANMLITVGFRARTMGEAALDVGMSDINIREYEQGESDRAGLELEREIGEGDIVLIKGSQSMRMERTVFALMAHPEHAGKLLVRQNVEWLAR